jgi:8-oxo-dGTP diphosphatase
MVDVVVGIIFHERKFLADKRKTSDKIDPGIVSLPGGHVELGETRKAALIRELKEEFNIDAKKTRFIKKSHWVAGNGEKQNVYYFLILDYKGKPVRRTAQRILWIEEMEELDIDIDRQAVEKARIVFQQDSCFKANHRVPFWLQLITFGVYVRL